MDEIYGCGTDFPRTLSEAFCGLARRKLTWRLISSVISPVTRAMSIVSFMMEPIQQRNAGNRLVFREATT